MIKAIKSHQWLQRLLWIILLIAIWEITSRLKLTNNYLLPAFSTVLAELIRQMKEGLFFLQIFNSFVMILIGFFVSMFLSAGIVILCTWSEVIRSFVKTLCAILTPLPGVALMPVIIMFFGIRELSMVVLMIHSVLWPMIINTLGGIASVKKEYTNFGRNIELSDVCQVKDIYLFALMPSIIAGARIGWGRAWRALISAEMVFGTIGNLGGIGYFIYTNRAFGNMTRVMVGVITVIIIGIIVESVVFGVIEKLTVRKWGLFNEGT